MIKHKKRHRLLAIIRRHDCAGPRISDFVRGGILSAPLMLAQPQAVQNASKI